MSGRVSTQAAALDPHTRGVLHQLLIVHGARRLIDAVAASSVELGDVLERERPKDATAVFAHRANATVLRSIVGKLYS